ncbi:MAG: (2Fe-2S) ferredoxin domain-containing protein, partial [Clostridia bacterium]|nr:(2Fe-2S) ferredoxin domain-containing protein [Clostridia bacterium]
MTLEQLTQIWEAGQDTVNLRKATGVPSTGVHHIMVCGGTGCNSAGSHKLKEIFESEAERLGITDKVKVVMTGCFGLCALGPIVIVYPEGTFYSQVQADDVPEIVEKHLIGGEPVARLVYEDIGDLQLPEGHSPTLFDTTFYHKQLRLALRNCGAINPEDINEYIAVDG